VGWQATLGAQPHGSVFSIFFWQQNRGHAAVGFRDDPDSGSVREPIARKDSPAVFEGEFVFTAIVFVQFAPVSCQMTL
jgi:hypothetical protein